MCGVSLRVIHISFGKLFAGEYICEENYKKAAVSYLVNETGLSFDECDKAYDYYMEMFSF